MPRINRKDSPVFELFANPVTFGPAVIFCAIVAAAVLASASARFL